MRVRTITLLFVLLTVTNAWSLAWCDEDAPQKDTPQKTVKITISPETTYITEPLLPDGRVDYYGAINRMLAEGVTAENNIYTGFVTLLPGEFERSLLLAHYEGKDSTRDMESKTKFCEKYCQMLGLDSVPDLDSLQHVGPPGSFEPDHVDSYQHLLRFYPQDVIDAKIAMKKSEEEERFLAWHKNGEMDDATLAEELKWLETEEFRKQACRSIINDEYYYDGAMSRIFTEDEFPMSADWMKESTGLAEKLIEISKRPQSYNPLVRMNDDDAMYEAALPYVQSIREVARYFCVRGRWHFGRGEYDEAMECAFTSQRIGTTMRSNSGCVVEDLVGIAIQGIATHDIMTYLGHLEKEKDAAWILARQKEFRTICEQGKKRPQVPIWFIEERFEALSVIAKTAFNPALMEEYFGNEGIFGQEGQDFITFFKKCYDPDYDYDWDKVLSLVNLSWEDKEDFMLIPDTMRRAKAFDRLWDRISEKAHFIKDMAITSETDRNRLLADFFHCTMSPYMSNVFYASSRIECLEQMTDVGFSVAAYRSDHGQFPETLDALVPKYLDCVPVSLYTNKPLRYLKRANDVLLVNDETFQFDGSEEEVEKEIAEAPVGDFVYPNPRSFIVILHKER